MSAGAALLLMLLLLPCGCLYGAPVDTTHLYIVVHMFVRFSTTHNFEKPNDKRALDLMDECAKVSSTCCPVLLPV